MSSWKPCAHAPTLCLLIMLLAALPALGQSSPEFAQQLTSGELGKLVAEEQPFFDADSNEDIFEGEIGFGYSKKTGAVAIEAGRVFVHCPIDRVLVVNAELAEVAADQLKAKVLDDKTWVIEGEKITVQHANAVYATEETPDEEVAGLQASRSLQTVARRDLFSPILARSCHSIWQRYKCDLGPFICPGPGCFNGFDFVNRRYWWRCRYTGNPFDFCAERLQHVCTRRQFTCRDCTGPIIAQQRLFAPACVVLP